MRTCAHAQRNHSLREERKIPSSPATGGCGKAGRFATSKKKGDFFRLIWAEIFLHKSLTDSGISHRFLCLFSFYTIARRFEYLHICGIFLHRCRRKISSNIAARGGLLGQGSVDGVVGSGTIGGVGVTTGSGRTDEKTSTSTRR